MTRGMFIAACAAGGLLSMPARAEDWRDRETRSITVDSAGLDLSTDADLDELSYRIGRAVRRICGSDRVCEDEAWASTEGQVAWVVSHAEWRRRMAEANTVERVQYLPPCPPGSYVVSVTVLPGPAFYGR